MELTRTFTAEEYTRALASWQWIGLEGLDPWFVSAFGDIFLTGDDGVYWLDITSGELTHAFASAEDTQRILATEEGMDEYLLAGLAFAAAEQGVDGGAGDVLAFKVPPILDGEFEVANLEVLDFVTAVSRAGRLHDKIKDLPDGTEIPDDL